MLSAFQSKEINILLFSIHRTLVINKEGQYCILLTQKIIASSRHPAAGVSEW